MDCEELRLADDLGALCADGEKALSYRSHKVDPILDQVDCIRLDFEGVRNMNSSFANALVANLVSERGPDVLHKLRFKNCRPRVKTMLKSAIRLGKKRYKKYEYA